MTPEEAIRIIKEECYVSNLLDIDKTIFINTALDMAVEALKQTMWTSVSERLPEVDVDVLVTDNGGGLPTVHIDACGMKDGTGERFWYISQTPIAWMEWPEPYNAESEDKK